MIARVRKLLNYLMGKKKTTRRSTSRSKQSAGKVAQTNHQDGGIHKKGHFEKQHIWPVTNEHHKGPKV